MEIFGIPRFGINDPCARRLIIIKNAFDLHSLKRSFFGVAVISLVGIPLMLLANIVLARTLTVADFGTFGFVIALATVLAIPTSAGLPMLLTREVASYSQRGDWSSYRGIVRSAHAWVIAATVMVGVGFAAWWVLVRPDNANTLPAAFVLIPIFGFTSIRTGVLKGLGRPMLAEAPVQILQPLVLVAGYFGLAWFGYSTASNALWWYALTSMVICVLAAVALRHILSKRSRGVAPNLSERPRWCKALVPFALISASTVLSAQTAILLLGFFGQQEAVALLRVAERGAQLVAFPLAFVASILGPYVVNAMNSGRSEELANVARLSARLSLATSLPVALVLLLSGEWLIRVTFGAPYDQLSYEPLVILIGAQIFSVLMGNGGVLLAMAGQERETVYGLMSGIIAILICGVLLIESHGAVGGALAAASGIAVSKLYFFVAVRRRLGFSSAII